MMSSKRTSQLAVLSIVLTFTHSVGQAHPVPASVELKTVYIESQSAKKDQSSRKDKQKARKYSRINNETCLSPTSYVFSTSNTESAVLQKKSKFSRCSPRSVKKNKTLQQAPGEVEKTTREKRSFTSFLKRCFQKSTEETLSSDAHQKVQLGGVVHEGSLVSVKKHCATRSSVSCPEFLETQIVRAP
ncbi:hypothetical protein Cs308_0001, partial [Candidatus Chlamydia sanziniae]